MIDDVVGEMEIGIALPPPDKGDVCDNWRVGELCDNGGRQIFVGGETGFDDEGVVGVVQSLIVAC